MYPYSGFAARNLAGVAHGAAPAYFDPFEAALVFAVIRPPAGPHRMTSASPGIVGGRAGLADGHAVSVREGFRVDRPAVFDIQPQPQQVALAALGADERIIPIQPITHSSSPTKWCA